MADAHLSPAECVFETFGGISETARVLGLNKGSVKRWLNGLRPGETQLRRSGAVPVHHFLALMAEARRRGKRLSLEDLVFGRAPVIEGVVTVRDGVRVKVRRPEVFVTMVKSLEKAGG